MKSVTLNGKIVYIISLVENSLAFEWYFEALKKIVPDFIVVFLHPSEPALMKKLSLMKIDVHWFHYSGKKDFASILWRLRRYLRKLKPQVVHTHLFDASMAGLLAAKLSGVPVRIHTRHHASQHHIYHPHAVKYDRFINSLSTGIIAISENIKEILVEKESVNPAKVKVVHHGFNLDYFSVKDPERVELLRRRYAVKKENFVVGMISRFTVWKGIQYVIPAFKEFLKQKPDAILVLANANGDYEKEILTQLKSELPESAYRLIKFEADSPALYALFSVFVHVPVDDHSEAFGQVYVEAFAAGVPCVYTLSGIAREFVRDRKNAIVVPYCDSVAIEKAIFELSENPALAADLKIQAGSDAKEFGIDKMVQHTLSLYVA